VFLLTMAMGSYTQLTKQLSTSRLTFTLCRRLSSQVDHHRSSLMSCKQLSQIQEHPTWHDKYRILDARWGFNNSDSFVEHQYNRIPGSKYFDLEECRDHSSPYLMMLPSMGEFEEYVSELGISNEHHVVIYDNHPSFPMFSSPRLWWMFRVLGHDNVSVLDGGLQRWLQDGHPVACGGYTVEEDLPESTHKFSATFRPEFLKDLKFIKENAESTNPATVLESRGFNTLPGDVEDLSDVSVPCARLASFANFADVDKRQLRSASEIEHFFSSRNIDLDTAVTSCGRGVTASIVSFCIYYATGKNIPVYDGSWSEWSQHR